MQMSGRKQTKKNNKTLSYVKKNLKNKLINILKLKKNKIVRLLALCDIGDVL